VGFAEKRNDRTGRPSSPRGTGRESGSGGVVDGRSVGFCDCGGAGGIEVFRGAVVAYQLPVKTSLLNVPAAMLEEHGAVSAPVAEAMATGAKEALEATWSVATTGVAGPDPDPQTGLEPGTVVISVAGPGGVIVTEKAVLVGNRAEIRAQSVEKALWLLNSALERE